jgi:hypothetical protein
LVSAGFLGLVKAARQMARGCKIKHPDKWTPVGCIMAWVKKELRELLANKNFIRVPPRSKYRAKAEGRKLVLPKVKTGIPASFIAGELSELDIRDFLDSCCRSADERSCLQMREANHTYTKMAAEINRPLSSTYRLSKRLENRVFHKLQHLQ